MERNSQYNEVFDAEKRKKLEEAYVDAFLEPIYDDMDAYSNDAIDFQQENGEISAEEAAFMRGYNAE